jgi:GMP synthase-like glutamine amidotransferase
LQTLKFVLYLDIEHPKALLKQRQRARHLKKLHRNSQLFRELSGVGCLAQSFIWLDGSHLDDLPLLAMVIGGNRTDWETYTPTQLREPLAAIRSAQVPVLGICGGHQMLCTAFGGVVRPMKRPGGGGGPSATGMFKEKGYTAVKVDPDDPLFRGLGDEILVHESHYCEVVKVPPVLRATASSAVCKVQALAHRDRPVHGVQFHPETFDDEHPDGRKVLENFFSIAGSFTH